MENREVLERPLVVNLYAGPGAGKTVLAMSIVAELKKKGIHAEYVSEVAKDCVYKLNNQKLSEADREAARTFLSGRFDTQKALLDEQQYRLDIFAGSDQVEVVITDSPLVLLAAYLNEESKDLRWDFECMAKAKYDQYHNLDYFLFREPGEFEVQGRIHNLQESMTKDTEIKDLLARVGIPYKSIYRSMVMSIVSEINWEINLRRAL